MIRLTFTSGSDRRVLELSKMDYELLKVGDPNCFLRAVIMRPRRRQKPVSFSIQDVRAGLSNLASALEDERLYFKYSHSADVHEVGDNLGFSTGGRSGLLLSGEHGFAFSIWSGIGFCKLRRLQIDSQTGRGIPSGEIDIRDRQEIATTNMGMIRIRRERICSELKQKIMDLANWAQGISEVVTVELVHE